MGTRPDSLDGTAIGDHYRALADARQLAEGEEHHLVGLAAQVAPAPVVRVRELELEVNDLDSLGALADVLFAGED